MCGATERSGVASTHGVVMRRGWFCPLLNNASFECGNWPALGGRALLDRLSLGDLGGEGKYFFG